MDLPLPKPNIDFSGNHSMFSDGSSDNKRKIILFAGIFGILAIAALIAGIVLSPSHSPKDILPKSKSNGKSLTAQKATQKNDQTLLNSLPGEPTEVPTVASYDYAAEDTPEVFYTPTPTPSPTPTPLPGPFYIPNGKQNDLTWKLTFQNDWDIFDEVHLINTKTHEDRLLGRALDTSPGDSTFFSKDFSQLIFIGGKTDQVDYERINFYSIPKNTIVRQIALADMKAQLPSLNIQDLSILCRMFLSPNGGKIAFSYGKTWDTHDKIDPDSVMILLDLQTNRMTMLKTRGIVSSWKDDNTILYEVSNPADPNNNTIAETSINDIQN